MKQSTNNWKERRGELLLTLLLLGITLFLFSRFVMWVESRPGVALDDPFLALFSPIDLTWPIFAVIYGGIFLGLFRLWRRPDALLLMVQSYILLLLIRITAMYVTPFAPPEEMIVLSDPVAGLGPGGAMTNDLFFSGHTATIFLFYLTTVDRLSQRIFLVLTILLAFMLLFQHVHYTVDVLAAPFFAYGAYRIARIIRNQLPAT